MTMTVRRFQCGFSRAATGTPLFRVWQQRVAGSFWWGKIGEAGESGADPRAPSRRPCVAARRLCLMPRRSPHFIPPWVKSSSDLRPHSAQHFGSFSH